MRGIETHHLHVAGTVEYDDGMGDHDAIAREGVQWITAGIGIIHHETPKGPATRTRMHGFQLWANLRLRSR